MENSTVKIKEQTNTKMETFEPLVSIVIPVYNGSNYLKEAIDSALAQTYKNIEVIVVNDGSNDNGRTEEIALSYGSKIRYFNKKNGGTSTALNLGIHEMKGEYFSWLSHDDKYYPKKIKRQVEILSDLNDKNTIIMTDLDGINENYEFIYKTNYILHINNYPPRKESLLHPIVYNQTHGCTLLIPRICFDTVGLFDEKELVAQDFEFFYRAFAKFPHKLIPEILVTARDSSNRQGKRAKERCNIEYSRLFIKIIENLEENEIKLLAPSRLDFYLDMKTFYTDAGYTIALDYINKKLVSNVQISSFDLMGQRFNGHDLHLYLREIGLDSKQIVAFKMSDDKNTFIFNFDTKNSTKELLQQKIFIDSDIIHLHLVHNILDISYLPLITKLKPTILTLHDPFYLAGHCIHSFDCEKWQNYCFDCQYLDRDFRLPTDTSLLNFYMKKNAIQNSQIVGIVASKWMMNKVKKSPIWKDKEVYYLPFGIDQNIFKPGDSSKIRNDKGIPVENVVLLIRTEQWEVKGIDIIIDSLEKIERSNNITIVTVGHQGLLDQFKSKFEIIEYGWVNDTVKMVELYQLCDIFLMPSRQETFGLMAIEAMSCGKMVLAIDSTGSALPDVINSPDCGLAVTASVFASEIIRLLASKQEIFERGKKCYDYAKLYYSKENYISEMITIYKKVIENHKLDSDANLLLQQLKKYANNDLLSSDYTVEKERISFKYVVKKIIRFFAKLIWKLISFLNLKKTVKSTKLYKRMAYNGIINKLRG